MPDSALPPHLQGTKHWDWWGPFKKVPRGWTSFNWGKPKLLAGNQKETRQGAPAPIPEAGSWQLSRFPNAPGLLKYLPLYLAITLKSGRHYRIGARFDDVDNYTTMPVFATRHYPPQTGGERDTSTK